MRTVKRNPFLSGICAILGGAFLWAGAAAQADVVSDRSAAILVLPKLLYSSAADDTLTAPGQVIDTEIQITNTSEEAVRVRCFYVNANSHCTNDPRLICNNNADCQPPRAPGFGGLCYEGWIEIDFEFTLTPMQPIFWKLSTGDFLLPCAEKPCEGGLQIGSIPAANEDPFQGELKCIQVSETNEPVDRNDLKGEATIITASAPGVGLGAALDARAYNGVGIQAIPGAVNTDNTLRLGEEYNGCPNILILDHFFEDAVEPLNGDYVKTHLTLVPCSQNFELQELALFDTTVQYLVYNEFEQRFSASRRIRCFKEIELCHIDNGGNRPLTGAASYDPKYNSCQRSIFSAFVNGTLTGQTRIRGVDDGSEAHGNGLIGVAEEFHRSNADDLRTVVGSAAFNIHQAGVRADVDIIQLP